MGAYWEEKGLQRVGEGSNPRALSSLDRLTSALANELPKFICNYTLLSVYERFGTEVIDNHPEFSSTYA
jgi:hypothetical protein